ncbi:MAG: prepilin-type N-terminal cleavage/methylation domain-containing protein [Candidatus Delongbacteria bacterium]|jgi:prepilin-type N-terminal cleavage/methylation domain-containing protein|nr:prepilin-type N-terminal cleavage/methylation domain-containing protein [Candidatus Delongbacteria bacterium]
MKKGLTLVEVIVVAVLAAIVGAGSLFFIVDANHMINSSVQEAMVKANFTRIENMISNDVRSGAILKAVTEEELLITLTDGSNITWKFVSGQFTRDDVPMKLIGMGESTNEISGTFSVPNITSNLFFVDISIDVLIESYVVGENLKQNIISTRVYCRHDPSGFPDIFDPGDYIADEE